MSGLSFKITIRRQLSMLSWMLIVYGLLGLVYVYFFGFKINRFFALAFLAAFLFDICPPLIAHTQYYIANSHATLTIDKEDQILMYNSPKECMSYHFDDIAVVEHVASYGGGAWYSFSEYRYFRITFKDKKQLIITCLMMEDIKDTLEMLLRVRAQKKMKLVAFI